MQGKIDVEILLLGFGKCLTKSKDLYLKTLLLLLIDGGHLGKTFIGDFSIEGMLAELLDDVVRFGDALCNSRLHSQNSQLRSHLLFLVGSFINRDSRLHTKVSIRFISDSKICSCTLRILWEVQFPFLLAVGGAHEMLLFMCQFSG